MVSPLLSICLIHSNVLDCCEEFCHHQEQFVPLIPRELSFQSYTPSQLKDNLTSQKISNIQIQIYNNTLLPSTFGLLSTVTYDIYYFILKLKVIQTDSHPFLTFMFQYFAFTIPTTSQIILSFSDLQIHSLKFSFFLYFPQLFGHMAKKSQNWAKKNFKASLIGVLQGSTM